MNRARSIAFLFALLAATPLVAQQQPPQKGESYFATTFTIEGHDIKEGCKRTEQVLDDKGKEQTEKKPWKVLVPGCLIPLFHGNKGLYGSFQNLPPGNGLALGAAFKDSELNAGKWRMNYQVDGQGSFNGSWTAGGFLTMRLAPTIETKPGPTPTEAQTATNPPPANPNKPRMLHPPIVHQGPMPKHLPDLAENETKLILNFYAFHTSLNQVSFFGIGPNTVPADRSFFALRETVSGVSTNVLLKYGFHLLGELNGRWPTIGGDHGQSSPSIEQVYSEATAPGLARQPGFLQLGEGLQYTHHGGGLGTKDFGADYDLDWGANFQQFFAPSISMYSFRRITIDATNDINLLKRFKPKYGAATSEQFGTLELRGWLSQSIVPAGHVVPFYFQPTLGGGDIDKERTLASFADYRFRAPNALLLRAQYEQPLPKYSFLGVIFRADTGKVADSRGDIDFSHLRHSYGAGLTIRAGNFPYLIFMYAWGGGEGHHTFADLNMSAISPTGGSASLW
jgi:hypothetical protein